MKNEDLTISKFLEAYPTEKTEEYLWDMFTHAFFGEEKTHLAKQHGTDLAFRYKLVTKIIALQAGLYGDELINADKFNWLIDAFELDSVISFLDEMFYSFIGTEAFGGFNEEYRLGVVQFFHDLKGFMVASERSLSRTFISDIIN